jgi:hypothetical protein
MKFNFIYRCHKVTKLQIDEECIFNNIMINLLPKCSKCGSSVTDSIESQIEQHEKIKMGNYINSEWICDDCLGGEHKDKEYSSSHTNQSNNSNNNNNQCDNIGTASESDVSPNTPRSDEANL